MTGIFLSYKRENEGRAARLVAAQEGAGRAPLLIPSSNACRG